MKTWLVIDVSYMCHRAFHTAKHLSWGGKPTGVVFGFLKSIGLLKQEFQTDRVAFCFEHPKLKRREIYPQYKMRRHTERSPKEVREIGVLKQQIIQLQQEYLPRIGFENVIAHHGYESDDLMAQIAAYCPKDEEVVLVTADSDLYQCLRPNVIMYSPQKQKVFTERWFKKTYGIEPKLWAMVKAIAGCHGDEVKGVPGIGEKTALKFVQRCLPTKSKAFNQIFCAEGKAIVRRNRRLVELPFEGCPVPILTEDKVDTRGWQAVCERLGMKSIAGTPPILGL